MGLCNQLYLLALSSLEEFSVIHKPAQESSRSFFISLAGLPSIMDDLDISRSSNKASIFEAYPYLFMSPLMAADIMLCFTLANRLSYFAMM